MGHTSLGLVQGASHLQMYSTKFACQHVLPECIRLTRFGNCQDHEIWLHVVILAVN